MFKRLFWLIVGASFGFGVAFWLMRAVRETASKYTPAGIGSDLADAIRQLGSDLRAAADEGRAAMRETEDELRTTLGSVGPRR
ncbi:MAG: hypothetical protein ACXIVQ_15610 [Acidimicrobiales bacterium]